MTLVAYSHPVGARVALVDCNGGNRVEGEAAAAGKPPEDGA